MDCFSSTVVNASLRARTGRRRTWGRSPVEPGHILGGGGEEVVKLVGDGGDAGLDGGVLITRSPSTSTSPPSCRYTPVMWRSTVDLPAPLGPTRP